MVPDPTVNITQETAIVELGKVVNLNASTNPLGEVITWSTSDALTATVTDDGGVTGIKKGEVVITAKLASGATDVCTVTVVTEILDTTINITEETANVNEGSSIQLNATTNPIGAVINWTSSDELTATVDSEGNVTGVKPGTAVIKAMTTGGAVDSCTITVEEVLGITDLSKGNISVYPNPTNGKLNFNNTGNISSVKLLNVQGQVLFEQTAVEGINTLSIDQLKNGMYLIQFSSNNIALSTKRVLKQ